MARGRDREVEPPQGSLVEEAVARLDPLGGGWQVAAVGVGPQADDLDAMLGVDAELVHHLGRGEGIRV